jgi:hypothetical protein
MIFLKSVSILTKIGDRDYLQTIIKKVPPQGAGYGNRLLANRWFPLQVYIFRPKGRGITPILD